MKRRRCSLFRVPGFGVGAFDAAAFGVGALVVGVLLCVAPNPVRAMGYDSLACPELAERRIEYFTNNGFCAPGAAEGTKDASGNGCKAPTAGPAGLPDGDRTQVEMILKVEARKGCPGQ